MNSQWVLALTASLVVVFSVTMFAGRTGSDWFKDEVEQSLLSIHGLEGLAQVSVSSTRPAVSSIHPAVVSHEHSLEEPKALKSVPTNARPSPSQQLEVEEPQDEEAHESGEAPEEPEEVEDCPIRLANGDIERLLACAVPPIHNIFTQASARRASTTFSSDTATSSPSEWPPHAHLRSVRQGECARTGGSWGSCCCSRSACSSSASTTAPRWPPCIRCWSAHSAHDANMQSLLHLHQRHKYAFSPRAPHRDVKMRTKYNACS